MKKSLIFVLLVLFCSGSVFGEALSLDMFDNITFEDTLKKAEQGDAIAQQNLGVMYSNGGKITQNYQKAVYWFKKAAEQGGVGAQYFLALMYRQGQGVTQDDKQSFFWFKKAAEQGDAISQNNLGLMYSNGKGTNPGL